MRAEIAMQGQLQQIVLDDLVVVHVSSDLLARATFEAVHKVGWPAVRHANDGRTPEPVLRTLLTYCYAAGICASEEIQEAVRHDPVVGYFGANHFPDWQEIRAFRRRNLPCLIEALALLFEKVAAGQDAPHLFGQRRSVFRAAAERRMARAIQSDSVALDA
jgi:hypothetical protein